MTILPSTTRDGAFAFGAEAHLAEWNGTSLDGSPYLYRLPHRTEGVVPRTPEWTGHDRDLARVRSAHAATAAGPPRCGPPSPDCPRGPARSGRSPRRTPTVPPRS